MELDKDLNNFANSDFSMDELKLAKLNFKTPTIPSAESTTVSTTSSFNALLSQNEDLAARLRVTLKRLSHIEAQNKFLSEDHETHKNQLLLLNDQLLIWQEKEKIWQEKEKTFEDKLSEKMREYEFELSILRQKTEKLIGLEENLERYRKYHEKIKTSVKPYIQNLKSYAESLFQQSQNLNSLLLEKEAELDNIRRQLDESKENSNKTNRSFELEKNQLILLFEEQRAELRSQIGMLQEENETLKEKTRIFDRSLERQDELENLIVALRRAKDDADQLQQTELKKIKDQMNSEAQEKALLLIKLSDFEKENSTLRQNQNHLEKTNTELNEQLASLRYLWSQKSQENEKLTQSAQALERINLELSQKLKALREQES